jgi:hypothetical protein
VTTEAVRKSSALSPIEINELKIPSVFQFCEFSNSKFCRIKLQRRRFLFLHSLDPKETLSTGSLLACRIDNVAVFEYTNLRASAYQLDADRPRYLCSAGWEFPFLAWA